MAYFKRSRVGEEATASSSHVISLPASSQNDLVLVSMAVDGGSSVSSLTGDNAGTWATAVNRTGGDSFYVFACQQGATPDTSLTVAFAASERSSYIVSVFGGVDTTTPYLAVHQPFNSKSPKCPAITPTSANALIFYTGGCGGFHAFAPEGMYLLNNVREASRTSAFSAYTYHPDTSTRPEETFQLAKTTSFNCSMATIAIYDDGNGDIDGYHDLTADAFQYLHFMVNQGGILSDDVEYDPTLVANENISSVSNGSYTNSTCIYHTIRTENESILEPDYMSKGHGINSTSNNGDAAFTGHNITTTDGSQVNYDLSGEILVVNTKLDNGNVTDESKIGTAFGISDKASGNYRLWQLRTQSSSPTANAGLYPDVIDVDDATFVMDEGGTPNTADIGALLICSESTFTSNKLNVAPVIILRTMKIHGGSSGRPASFKTCYDIAKRGMLNTILSQGGIADKQFLVAHDTQCGGAETVYWDSSNQSVEWPAAYNADNAQRSFKIAAGKLTHTIAPITGSTVIYDSTTLNFGNFHNFVVNSSAVSLSTEGLVVLNADVTLTAHSGAMSGITFSGCKEITSSVDLSGGCTISNTDPSDSYAITVTNETEFNRLRNCTFSGNNYSIRITGNHGGSTWTGTGMTVSGGTGSYDIRYEGTGTLTIQMDSGSGWTQLRSEATVGTLTITSPPLTLAINSDTASTLIRYFEDDSQTVVDSTTGTTLNYEYPDTDPVDIELVKQGYVPVNRQNVTPYDGDYDVIMDFDESYNSSHGLTITTEFDYVRATKVLTINSDQEALDVRSALADVIRTNSSYYNTSLLMVSIPGLTRVDLTDGMTITSMATWKGAGMERFDAADSSNPVEKWFAIKSVGDITGATVHYRQTDSGTSTAVTLTSNVVNEAFQYYSDPNHDGSTADGYDYSGYMVIKSFLAGSKQGRVDVVSNSGLSALASNLYTVPLANESHDYSGTDPGITADLTMVAGGTVGGKVFAYKWVDAGTNTGENIADQLNYNAANDPTGLIPGGTGLRWFDLGDMVIHNASSVETERCLEEGTTPAYKGFYVERSSADHPDFTRFQADDGTYYVPVVQVSVINSNLASGTRVQIYNVTQATELYNNTLSGAGLSESFTYGTGQQIESGDTIRYRASYHTGTTYKLPIEGTAVASGGNITFLDTQAAWTAVESWAIDGSGVTEYTADGTNIDIDLDDPDGATTKTRLGAWWAYYITTASGIADFWNAYSIPAANVIMQDVSILDVVIHNVGTLNVRFTDNDVRYYRSDNSLPYDTTGNSIFMDYTGVPDVVETGTSGLTTAESNQLNSIDSKTSSMTFSKANELDVNIKSVKDTTVTGSGTSVDPWGP